MTIISENEKIRIAETKEEWELLNGIKAPEHYEFTKPSINKYTPKIRKREFKKGIDLGTKPCVECGKQRNIYNGFTTTEDGKEICVWCKIRLKGKNGS